MKALSYMTEVLDGYSHTIDEHRKGTVYHVSGYSETHHISANIHYDGTVRFVIIDKDTSRIDDIVAIINMTKMHSKWFTEQYIRACEKHRII